MYKITEFDGHRVPWVILMGTGYAEQILKKGARLWIKWETGNNNIHINCLTTASKHTYLRAVLVDMTVFFCGNTHTSLAWKIVSKPVVSYLGEPRYRNYIWQPQITDRSWLTWICLFPIFGASWQMTVYQAVPLHCLGSLRLCWASELSPKKLCLCWKGIGKSDV